MGSFKKQKVKTPAVPPPAAIPEISPETGDEAMKRARRRRGFERTFLTGQKTPQSKSLLG